jgi:hypothetical protein
VFTGNHDGQPDLEVRCERELAQLVQRTQCLPGKKPLSDSGNNEAPTGKNRATIIVQIAPFGDSGFIEGGFMSSKSKTILSLFLFSMLFAAGCGGGGSGNNTPPPPPPTITSVSASCTITSLVAGSTQTSQCNATVTGTGSYSSSVTWSAGAGTITSAGVYTAPATVPATNPVKITATSTEDTTKSGQANITITAARVITLTPKYSVVSQVEAVQGNTFAVQINTTGTVAGDVIDTTETGTMTPYTITATDVTNGYFTAHVGIEEIASFVQFACPTSATVVCNPAWVAITSDQRQLAENTSSTTAYFNPRYGYEIQEFSLSSEASEGNISPPLQTSLPATMSNDNYAITVDGGSAGTGTVLADVAYQAVNSNAGSGTTGVIQPSSSLPKDELASIVAWNKFGYVTEPNVNAPNPGSLAQFPISTTSGLGTISTVAAGAGPYALDAATVNGVDAIVVFSADTTVRLFNNALTPESTLTAGLTNITPLGTVATTDGTNGSAIGGWPLRIIGGTGTAAGTVGVLSSYDNVLDFLTINSSNVISWAGATNGAVKFSGNPYPYMIAPDPTHGAFIVAFADTTNGVTTLQSISATSPYTATPISTSTLPTGFLASGILVSDDGTKIYVAGFICTDATQTLKFYAVVN